MENNTLPESWKIGLFHWVASHDSLLEAIFTRSLYVPDEPINFRDDRGNEFAIEARHVTPEFIKEAYHLKEMIEREQAVN